MHAAIEQTEFEPLKWSIVGSRGVLLVQTRPLFRSSPVIELVTYRHNWGEGRVYFHDRSGLLRSIPACWTTVMPADPFVVLAAGRCHFRYDDLLKLADLVEKAR